jgi:hypothetical protein
MCDPDGDTYRLGNNTTLMKEKFAEASRSEYYDRVVLAEVDENSTFGFGAQGEFFGGDVILDCLKLHRSDVILDTEDNN